MDTVLHGRQNCRNIVVAGFPMEYIKDLTNPTNRVDRVLFTQRNAPEKQPWLFDKISDILTPLGIECVNVQKLGASKEQYHEYLNSSKMVLSFALQETLGITPYEALVCGCDILVPDRLSYSEMYSEEFKYSNEMTIPELAKLVVERLELYDSRK